MRTIGFMETAGGKREILPRTYGIESIEARRRMFFMLINDLLCEEAKIAVEEEALFRYSLHTIFKAKIFSFFQMYRLRPERSRPIVKLYARESLLFNQFFKQERDAKSRYLTRGVQFDPDFSMLIGYTHPAATLIRMIFDGKNVGLTLDLNRLFAETVYRRIPREAGMTVTLDMPYIHIDSHGVRTRLYPRWKRMDPGNERAKNATLKEGMKQLGDDGVDRCYLLYPKTRKFRRHIEVETGGAGHLKVVPYSFTFCNRAKNGSRKTKAERRAG